MIICIYGRKKEEAKPIWEPHQLTESEEERAEKMSWFDVNWNKINPLNSKKWCGVKNATHKNIYY